MLEQQLQTVIEPVVNAFGYELWGFHYINNPNGGNTLRVYVDGENGISIDACAAISRQLSKVLDVEDIISGHYYLEVSSPGINRELFKLVHYQKMLGQQIKLRTYSAVNERRNFKGLLVAAVDETIIVKIDDDSEQQFKLSDIEKANVIAQ